jgi:hypothetical protein
MGLTNSVFADLVLFSFLIVIVITLIAIHIEIPLKGILREKRKRKVEEQGFDEALSNAI